MFNKKMVSKLNGVTEITDNTITINNDFVVECDGEYIFIHKIGGFRNYCFKNVSRETLTLKMLQIYIDNVYYDNENGLFDMGGMI